MSDLELRRAEKGVLQVVGNLDLTTVSSAYRSQEIVAADGESVTVDLQDVRRADSAALALMLAWLRLAQQHQRKLVFRNIPEKLMAIARVCGVAELLPLIDPAPKRPGPKEPG